ncbi:MAG: hypothetical protein GVY13_02530 [Alphaproteobacteria bacterium]|nr:hypothetical protein [Alphaproteobacteria bacterium]
MRLHRIRLELARCREFPLGSAVRGYEFVVPLRDGGEVDVPACEDRPQRCSVRRFWPGEDEESGHLVHQGDHRWAIRFDGTAVDPDEAEEEPIFQFDRHRIVEGQYLTIRERDEVDRTFRIVSIR